MLCFGYREKLVYLVHVNPTTGQVVPSGGHCVLYEIVPFKNARWQHVIVADRISRCVVCIVREMKMLQCDRVYYVWMMLLTTR